MLRDSHFALRVWYLDEFLRHVVESFDPFILGVQTVLKLLVSLEERSHRLYGTLKNHIATSL